MESTAVRYLVPGMTSRAYALECTQHALVSGTVVTLFLGHVGGEKCPGMIISRKTLESVYVWESSVSLIRISLHPIYHEIRILRTGAYFRNWQPEWVLIFMVLMN